MRRRGELLERSFAHTLESGGMREAHLRGRANILKRYLVHVAGFNLSLIMRRIFGAGTPRGLQGRLEALLSALGVLMTCFRQLIPSDQAQPLGPDQARVAA